MTTEMPDLSEERTGKHPLHSMCTYLGAFPPAVPREIMDRWVPPGATVLDPFCGSGTTILEARLSGRHAVGLDQNPLAVALARAKSVHVTEVDVLDRLRELGRDFVPNHLPDDANENIRLIFHERTLAQLAYLRDVMSPDESEEDAFILGALLGIMHGKMRKDGTSLYLSIDMPNTFSMSPRYVDKFVQRNGLVRPAVDVFEKLRARVSWLFREGPLPKSATGVVGRGDATQIPSNLAALGVRRVDAIVTSPPYLGVLRYGAFNWIRLWMLRESAPDIDRTLDSTGSLDRYLSFMHSFISAAGEVLPTDAPLVLVIGDVVDSESGDQTELAADLWHELDDHVPFRLEEHLVDDFDISSKTTRIWGDSRKGRATPLDRILVLRRLSK